MSFMKRFCCAAAAALLILAGCSSQKTIDSPEQLAKDLAEKITYQDELNRMEDALATQIYGVEEVKEKRSKGCRNPRSGEPGGSMTPKGGRCSKVAETQRVELCLPRASFAILRPS